MSRLRRLVRRIGRAEPGRSPPRMIDFMLIVLTAMLLMVVIGGMLMVIQKSGYGPF